MEMVEQEYLGQEVYHYREGNNEQSSTVDMALGCSYKHYASSSGYRSREVAVV